LNISALRDILDLFWQVNYARQSGGERCRSIRMGRPRDHPIANTAPLPVRVYANEGIAQLYSRPQICRFPMGKNQAQQKITNAKIKP
jgi:hypothetical protein